MYTVCWLHHFIYSVSLLITFRSLVHSSGHINPINLSYSMLTSMINRTSEVYFKHNIETNDVLVLNKMYLMHLPFLSQLAMLAKNEM